MSEYSALSIYIKKPWPLFYKNGMKTWDIRSYPTNYRGIVLLIESETNRLVCIASLIDCLELSKQRWEMNFDKHRVSSSYEDLPYHNAEGKVYAWVLDKLKAPIMQKEIPRVSSKPTQYFNLSTIQNIALSDIYLKRERFIIKPFGKFLQIFWIQQKYLALVAIIDTERNKTQLVENEIEKKDVILIKSELIPKC